MIGFSSSKTQVKEGRFWRFPNSDYFAEEKKKTEFGFIEGERRKTFLTSYCFGYRMEMFNKERIIVKQVKLPSTLFS